MWMQDAIGAAILGTAFAAVPLLAQVPDPVFLNGMLEYGVLGALVAWHTYTGWQREKVMLERMERLEGMLQQSMLKADAVHEMSDKIAEAAEFHRQAAAQVAAAVAHCTNAGS